MSDKPALIALDWGTTSFRCYLADITGAILDSRTEPLGILQVPQSDFDAVFQRYIGPWFDQYGELPAIASGMIGSRQGWQEVPYVPCPAGINEVRNGLIEIKTRNHHKLWLVPGAVYVDPTDVPDVMRGEETQIFGEIESLERQLFVLPGTHSKWIIVEDKRIVWFATFMSGEVFDVLCKHSILGRIMTGQAHSEKAFQRGLEYAMTQASGGLLKRLFSARTLALFDKVPNNELHAYLSGLIIGAEVVGGLACAAEQGLQNPDPLTIVGNPTLVDLYTKALTHHGVKCAPGRNHAVVTGLARIARDARLIP